MTMAGKINKSKMDAPHSDAVLVKWEQEEAITIHNVTSQPVSGKLIAHMTIREVLTGNRVANEYFGYVRLEGVEGGPFSLFAMNGMLREDIAEDENRLDVVAEEWLRDMLKRGRDRLDRWTK
jgi:hypothetical protein